MDSSWVDTRSCLQLQLVVVLNILFVKMDIYQLPVFCGPKAVLSKALRPSNCSLQPFAELNSDDTPDWTMCNITTFPSVGCLEPTCSLKLRLLVVLKLSRQTCLGGPEA